jgi:acyl-CoA reductase-like NAD-dependent aldehyde dehydrogenase
MTSVSLEATFRSLQAAARRDLFPPLAERDRRLARLEQCLLRHADSLAAAISADFGHRSTSETQLLELVPCLQAIRHAREHLPRWLAPERRAASRWFPTASASVLHQPLGVVGIIVPWNYPLFLAVSPLVGGLAAGNRVMLKLSELAPRTAEAMRAVLQDAFAADQVYAALGPADVGAAFSRLPFDHLLFTGSTAVGRLVMQAASANLTPVTIVADGYPMVHAAERIVLGKSLNAGQTCIAPDYVLVPARALDAFLTEAASAAQRLYPDVMHTADYSSIVNETHFGRLTAWLKDAQSMGARVVPLVAGCEPDPRTRRIPPTAIVGAPEHCSVMQEEIFGPLLPVVPYEALDEAIAYVAARPRPLALYYFDHEGAHVERVLHETIAGGVTINDVLMHIAQEDLPFGGVGASGMGHYHGRDGFMTFSHAKAVFRQSRINPGALLSPPYGQVFKRVVRFIMR